VPESFLKIVQPAEAGIVRQILVKEGEAVREGQVLMRMDSVAAEADGKTLELERRRKAMTLRRLDAEIGEREFALLPGNPPRCFANCRRSFVPTGRPRIRARRRASQPRKGAPGPRVGHTGQREAGRDPAALPGPG
jgi:multidrug efflux pump subunit AcrA (membrane-fusion protein)